MAARVGLYREKKEGGKRKGYAKVNLGRGRRPGDLSGPFYLRYFCSERNRRVRTTQAVTEHRGEPLLNEHRALREWRQQRRDDGSDFLFTSQKGGRLDRSQFFRLFQAIANEAGLPAEKQHPHALKHSIASHLVSANVNLALVKQQLGHKSIGSTMRYITTSDQQASKATASALMKIF